MAIFCGVDIIEIDRLKVSITEQKGFRDRVFTDSEISYCEKRNKAKFESYAARFAAKEAVLKALGKGIADGLEWRQIEVLNNELGKPYVVLYRRALELFNEMGAKSMDISLSHCSEYAVAYVVIDT
ncbi:MAG: holo-ACP synthase [Clostridiaceae bacterium]|jgi:holo-[acyl-carrier protein] synthase|nr:holo-ACP synthase [Clostridiaceae bacterium]